MVWSKQCEEWHAIKPLKDISIHVLFKVLVINSEAALRHAGGVCRGVVPDFSGSRQPDSWSDVRDQR